MISVSEKAEVKMCCFFLSSVNGQYNLQCGSLHSTLYSGRICVFGNMCNPEKNRCSTCEAIRVLKSDQMSVVYGEDLILSKAE